MKQKADRLLGKNNIDLPVFIGGVALMLIFVLGSLAFPDQTVQFTDAISNWVIDAWGSFFLLFGVLCLLFCVYLAFGRHRSKRMQTNENEATKEYSFTNWFAMIFFSALGSSTILWAISEPLAHISSPPFGLEPYSAEAYRLAIPYGIFHWGPIAWSFYALSGVAVSYIFYYRNKSDLKISSALDHLIPNNKFGFAVGRGADILSIFFTFCAYGPAFGLAVPTLTKMVIQLLPLNDSVWLQNVIMLLWTVIFTTSAYKGLNRGIKILSDVNLYLLLFITAVVFFMGDPFYMIRQMFDQTGTLIREFSRMNTYVAQGPQNEFIKNWTVFYWSWWLAMAPFMALFIAKISRGRSIREMVFGIIGGGTLGTGLVFSIFGSYVLKVQQTTVDLARSYVDGGVSDAVLSTISTMPMAKWMMGLMIVLYLIFIATCVDSSAFTMACIASKRLEDGQQPDRINRVAWALMIAALGFGVLRLGGGLMALQTIVVAIGLPAALLVLLMTGSLLKQWKIESKNRS